MEQLLISTYESLVRPALFCMDAEEAHHLGQGLLKSMGWLFDLSGAILGVSGLCGSGASSYATFGLAGATLKNPVGLAAGFDKNGTLVDSLASLGFGFVEIGSVTARPSAGNAKPRLFRLPQDQALINRLGLNGDGAEAVADRLQACQFPIPVGLNIAKTNLPDLSMEKAAEDIAFSFKTLMHLPFAYVVINTSCPNTHEGALFACEELELILKAVSELNQGRLPVFLKISPDSPQSFLEALSKLSLRYEIRGFVIGNTTVYRQSLKTSPKVLETIGNGGLSGAPLYANTCRLVKHFASSKAGYQEIIACGGIDSATSVKEMLALGASAVELYSALVYKGPFLIYSILQELKKEGFFNNQSAK